ncbi:MAG: repressor LexA, partial [Thermoanaerobaculia bacterium]
MNLTKRQKEILDFIRNYRREHGISPTQREIRETFHLSSFGTVQKHLKRLEEKGALSREWNRSRGIAPKDAAEGSRGVPLLGLVAAGRPIEPFPHEEAIEVPAA